METKLWNKTRKWNMLADDQEVFHNRVYTVLRTSITSIYWTKFHVFHNNQYSKVRLTTVVGVGTLTYCTKGGIHKLRCHDFANFWPPSHCLQVYRVILWHKSYLTDIWLTPPPFVLTKFMVAPMQTLKQLFEREHTFQCFFRQICLNCFFMY